ncbi:MAG: PAS domain-containing protein [Pirellulales bacterium]
MKQTKAELVAEIARLRHRLADLESSERAGCGLGAIEPGHDRLAAVEAILDNTPAVIYVKDSQGRYLLANRAYEIFFCLTRDQLIGRTDHDIFPAEAADALRANDLAVLESGAASQFEEVVPQAGEPRTYVSVKFPLVDSAGMPYAVCGISTDITERKRAEEQLTSEQRFLKQLIRAHERERQLIAYELHDGLVQYLSGALLHLESVTSEQGKLSEKGRAAVELAVHLLRRSIAEGRRVMSGLRPPILDEAGVVLAIAYLVAEQSVPGSLQIDFIHRVSFGRLEPLLEGTIYRIVQESLNNIKRHSKSQRAEVKLLERDGRIHLEVRDWGVGFNASDVPDDHFGLEGIRKRAALFGGRATIESRPGEGTRMIVDLPLGKEEGGTRKEE